MFQPLPKRKRPATVWGAQALVLLMGLPTFVFSGVIASTVLGELLFHGPLYSSKYIFSAGDVDMLISAAILLLYAVPHIVSFWGMVQGNAYGRWTGVVLIGAQGIIYGFSFTEQIYDRLQHHAFFSKEVLTGVAVGGLIVFLFLFLALSLVFGKRSSAFFAPRFE